MQEVQDKIEDASQRMIASGVIVAYHAALEQLDRQKIPKTDSAILRNMLERARHFIK